MKILYFSKDYTTHDHRFLSSLAASEHEVYFLQLAVSPRQYEDRALPADVHVVHWEDEKRSPRVLKKLLKQLKPDIVHAGPLQEVAWLVAKAGFSNLVSMSWGSDILVTADESPEMQKLTKYVLQHSKLLIGDCDAVRQKAISFGMDAEKIVIFPWGIDLKKYHPGKYADYRQRWVWEDNFVIYHSRSWEPIYDVGTLAKGFVMAAAQRPEMRLMMLGGGSMVHMLREIFQRGGVSDWVRFTGQVSQEDLPKYYQTADLYVSASKSDGSSVSLMEALGCGLPVLVTDIPGNREWVSEDNGWLFPVGDVKALADGLVKAYDEWESLKQFGENARVTAEARADWQKNFQLLLDGYKRIV